jgi:SpoVK/Ycf46/Vps4 family AAA+-type ATPase
MKNRNNKKICGKFKSHTDINNYNNFLLDLDNKLKKDNNHANKTISPKSSINKIINEIDNVSNNINILTPNICGITPWEMLLNALEQDLQDPNLHIQDNPILINDDIISKKNGSKNYSCIREKVFIKTEVNNIQDFLNLIEKYPDDNKFEYNINIKALHKIKEPLIELNNMIGINSLKENIVDQILFYIQNLHTLNSNSISGNDFMHTVIYGPPGTGKTEIAKIIGSIFAKLGILKKGTFRKVTRADLIAGYLGQTALKTRDVIKDCLGGVLFIDEAYALGNEEKRDSFSKECIDTLCEALSDNKDNLMVIIAGYESDLNECFFNYNQGLHSRFTWRFKTDEYNAEDLYKIFVKKVNDAKWKIDMSDNIVDIKWFEKNKKHFKFYGRDIETLFAKTKIAHSRRVFCLEETCKKNITLQDINKGLEIYLKTFNTQKKDDEERLKQIMSSMYM